MNGEVQEQSSNYNLDDLKPVLEKAVSNNILLDDLPVWLSAQTTKSAGRGRSAENTRQYGVQKLRELILQLAVRGKLVEQDSNDEPASILLEKIAEKKARLVKESKIRKQKSIPSIDIEEQPHQLPNCWCWTRLGTVAFKLTDGSHNPPRNAGTGFPMLSSQNVNFGQIDFSNPSRFVTETDFEKEDQRTQIKPGDVLLTIVASLGRAAVVPEDAPKFTLQRSVAVINSELMPEYLALHLVSPTCLSYYDEHGKGTAQKGIYLGKLSLMPLALPPLAEQHRIVKKVDELMALCDKLEQQQADAVQAHDTLVKVLLDNLTQSDNADDFQQNWHRIAEHFDTLFTTESSIAQLKQALLQLAVMGKLVPQNPNDEPASVLLEKIAEEKALLVKAGKMNKQKAIPGIADEEKPFYLPGGWSWARFGNVFTLEYGDNLPKPKRTNSGEYPVYGSNGIVGTHNTYSVGEPCIVIGRKGSAGALNLCEHEGCWVTDVAYSSAPPNGINLHFAFRLFHTLGLDNLGKGIKPGLNRNEAYLLPVALPPLAEQHRIVKKVDELMALCDQLKARLSHSQTLQQQLADAVANQSIR